MSACVSSDLTCVLVLNACAQWCSPNKHLIRYATEAGTLLSVAHKYDMPILLDMVKNFLMPGLGIDPRSEVCITSIAQPVTVAACTELIYSDSNFSSEIKHKYMYNVVRFQSPPYSLLCTLLKLCQCVCSNHKAHHCRDADVQAQLKMVCRFHVLAFHINR